MQAALAALSLILTLVAVTIRKPTSTGLRTVIASGRETGVTCCNETPRVTLKADGTVELNRRPMLPLELHLTLRDHFETQAEKAVFLYADHSVPYQQAARLISELHLVADQVVLIPAALERNPTCVSFRPWQ